MGTSGDRAAERRSPEKLTAYRVGTRLATAGGDFHDYWLNANVAAAPVPRDQLGVAAQDLARRLAVARGRRGLGAPPCTPPACSAGSPPSTTGGSRSPACAAWPWPTSSASSVRPARPTTTSPASSCRPPT